MPLVGMSGKIVRGNRGSRLGVLINDPINRFVGTISNLWNNAANWSLGIIPTVNQIAIIEATCQLNIVGTTTIKELRIQNNITFSYANGNITLTTGSFINNGTFNCSNTSGTPTINITSANVNIGSCIWGERSICRFNIYADFQIPNLDYYHLYIGASGNAEPVDAVTNKVIEGSIFATRGNLYITQNVTLNTNKTVIGGDLRIQYQSGANAYSKNVGILNIIKPNCKLIVNGLFYKNLYSCINFSGNPEIECQGGISGIGSGYTYIHNIGSGTWKFTTNNQDITNNSGQNGATVLPNILVDNIELTVTNTFTPNPILTNISAIGSSAKIINKATLQYNGVDLSNINLDCSFSGNVFIYGLAGDQNIKSVGYSELRLIASGDKKLIGNTTCEHLYFGGTATLDENGFALTGYTKYTDTTNLNRDIASVPTLTEIYFTSTVSGGVKKLISNIILNRLDYTTAYRIDLNGYTLSADIINWIVSQSSSPTNLIPLPSVIYTSIILSYTGGASRVILQEDLKVTTLILNGSTQSNVLFINENGHNIICDDWRYTSSETQYVYGRIYPNLVISGTGSKILQGNVVVTGTYQRIGAATINKNGFTIKNGSGVDLE